MCSISPVSSQDITVPPRHAPSYYEQIQLRRLGCAVVQGQGECRNRINLRFEAHSESQGVEFCAAVTRTGGGLLTFLCVMRAVSACCLVTWWLIVESMRVFDFLELNEAREGGGRVRRAADWERPVVLLTPAGTMDDHWVRRMGRRFQQQGLYYRSASWKDELLVCIFVFGVTAKLPVALAHLSRLTICVVWLTLSA